MLKTITLLLIAAAANCLAQSPAPELFMGNILNTGMQERDMAISPDGTEMYYTLQSGQGVFSTILIKRKQANGSWSDPEVASFSGRFADLEPAFSKDGMKLYFASNRPVNSEAKKDFDIWVTERNGSTWTEPRNLGAPVNTPGNEYYPSVASSGNLYFTGEYPGGIGREDIYVAKWEKGVYQAPVPLDTAVNSKTYEFNAFVSPDEGFIIFTSYGRKDDTGGGDLYISRRDAAGRWQKAVNLKALNSRRLDYCPFVDLNRNLLYFTSNRFDIPASYDKAVSYRDLHTRYNSPLNGSDNIYVVPFDAIK